MTKTELEIAQFLHNIAARSEVLANKIDPVMTRETSTAIILDGLRSKAKYGFSILVGRSVREVDSVELNTESHAPWTRAKKNREGRR